MDFLPLALFGSLVYFVVKLVNVGIRLSDTNVYFYTAVELLKGKILYKDIFFTNFPLFPYLSSVYSLISGGSLNLYYLTPFIETTATGLLIYFIIKQITKNSMVAFFCQLTYLFSFIILATSDHQTGVFIASLFSVFAYLFFIKGNKLLSGVFLGSMFMVKAYYLPVAIAFFIYAVVFERKRLFLMIVGFLIVILVVMAPTLLFARTEFIKDVFYYSLFRFQGINKLNIIRFFIVHDPLLAGLTLLLIVNMKKNMLIALILLFTSLFIFIYQDVYYLYLNILVPFIAIGMGNIFEIYKVFISKRYVGVVIFISIVVAFNLFGYYRSFSSLQIMPNIEEAVSVIKKQKPKYIYGIEEITTALAYLSQTPLLEGVVDTNESLFRKKILDADALTETAIQKKAVVVLKGIAYPENNLYEPIIGGIVDKEKIIKNCRLIMEIPVRSEDYINRVNIFNCALKP